VKKSKKLQAEERKNEKGRTNKDGRKEKTKAPK
jgi:hypothetical protein